jgi:hypothetical protein
MSSPGCANSSGQPLGGSRGAPEGRSPSYLTTISPVMDGWIVQWYGNVPALENWCE